MIEKDGSYYKITCSKEVQEKCLIDCTGMQYVPRLEVAIDDGCIQVEDDLKNKGEQMVERTESQGFDRFTGTVDDVVFEASTQDDRPDQYHVLMNPEDVTVEGKTGKMHQWLKIPKTATDSSVPQGSVIDAYITGLERLDKAVKSIATVKEVLEWMKSKKFVFNKEQPGKAFGKHEAADVWMPITLVK